MEIASTQQGAGVGVRYTSDLNTFTEEISHVYDLNITLSRYVTFKQQITAKVSALKSIVGWILQPLRIIDWLPKLTFWRHCSL